MTNPVPNPFSNWNQSVENNPAQNVIAHNLNKLKAIVQDKDAHPSPIRVAGSRHSMTACFATTGTQVRLEGEFQTRLQMNTDGTLTVGGGVTMLQIANFLQQLNPKRQLAVMPEVGNATAGSVACCGTKDSSFNIEDQKGPSQVSSTVVAVKMMKANGTVESVDARNSTAEAERLRVIRSSYGLLGIIYEVTFKTEPLTFARYTYEVLEWGDGHPLPTLADLRDGANSILGFMQPYDNQILVERRTLVAPIAPDALPSEEKVRREARRTTWQCTAAELAKLASNGVATTTSLASRILNLVGFSDIETKLNSLLSDTLFQVSNETMAQSLKALLDNFRSSRVDCMLNFHEDGPYFDFTFWAFPVSKWETLVPEYLKFVRAYKTETGFQKSLFTEVYLISKDNASFLTFSPDEDIFTLDMVHHDAKDQQWKEMNQRYNVFAAEHGGLPLLNQTKELTTSPQVHGTSVVRATLRDRWKEFFDKVKEEDPNERFMNAFFQSL